MAAEQLNTLALIMKYSTVKFQLVTASLITYRGGGAPGFMTSLTRPPQ